MPNIDNEITGDELVKVLDMTSDDITSSMICDMFAMRSEWITCPDGARKFVTRPPKHSVTDYFILPVNKFNTKKSGYTTIGIYIANLHLIQPRFAKLFGYINKPFDGKLIKYIEDKLSDELYYDRISTDDMVDWYNRLQWIGGNERMSFLSPSITPSLLKPPPGLMEKKAELMKKYEKELDPSNPNNALIAAKIEAELVSEAKKYLEQQDGYENFASKSKINIDNNYKTMNIMKGALLNSYTGKYMVNESEYNTGIKKEEYSSLADSAVLGANARAINTAKGGYLAKKSNQGLMTAMAGPKGSDCGTRQYLDVFLYPEMKNDYLNRYILDGGALRELTVENIDKYLNTTVKMRSPMYCKMKEPYYCNICLGNQPYLLGLEHFGLAISRISNKLLTLSMKKFHDLTVKTSKIDPDTIFNFDN